MLKQIDIRGFQNHKKLTIKLSRYVNTITGLNDAGKTAIFRALYWVAMNRPIHGRFLNHTLGKAVVTLTFNDCVVTRKKTRTINRYRLDGLVFKAFGSKVPQPIADAMALDEVNFQKQFDLPFWFLNTVGELSRELNKIVNLDTIDTITKKVAKRLKEAKAKHAWIKVSVTKAKEEYRKLKDVVLLDKKLQLVELLQGEADELEESYWSLADLFRKAVACKQEVTTTTKLFREASAASLYEAALNLLMATTNELETLIGKAKRYKSLQSKIIPSLAGVDLLKAELEEMEDQYEHFLQYYKHAIKAKGNLWRAKHLLKSTEEKLEIIQSTMKTCPTCGQTMLPPS